MPAYIGSKKVKELYYGGKKVKEAWYGGKKVYSTTKSGVYPWHDKQVYNQGDLVHDQGYVYKCIQGHQADRSTSKPGEGWDQYSYWNHVGYAYERDDLKYDPWEYARHYRVNDVVSAVVDGTERNFRCINYHTAGIDDRPGGPKGNQYWEEV